MRLSGFRVAAISAALVVPLFALEWWNRREFREEFPLLLFTFMSVHSLLIVLSAAPAETE